MDYLSFKTVSLSYLVLIEDQDPETILAFRVRITLFLNAFSFNSVSFLPKSTSIASLLPLLSPLYFSCINEKNEIYHKTSVRKEKENQNERKCSPTCRSAAARPLIFSSSFGSSTSIRFFSLSTGSPRSFNLSISFGFAFCSSCLLPLLPRRARILSIGTLSLKFFCCEGGVRDLDLDLSRLLRGGERDLDLDLEPTLEGERDILRAIGLFAGPLFSLTLPSPRCICGGGDLRKDERSFSAARGRCGGEMRRFLAGGLRLSRLPPPRRRGGDRLRTGDRERE